MLCFLKFIEQDLLLLLGLGVYVSQHRDVWEVYPELAQKSGHPTQKKSKHKEIQNKYWKQAVRQFQFKELQMEMPAQSHPKSQGKLL